MIKDCKMRHENGNCLPAGGFCTANNNICEALQNAYNHGYFEGCQTGFEKGKEEKWIPVSDRLPEYRDWYLGIFKEPDTGWINPIPFICDYVGHPTKITTKDFWILKEHDDEKEFGFVYYHNLTCVAWMPLPNPYKGDKE